MNNGVAVLVVEHGTLGCISYLRAPFAAVVGYQQNLGYRRGVTKLISGIQHVCKEKASINPWQDRLGNPPIII